MRSLRRVASVTAALTLLGVLGASLFSASASHLPVTDPDDTKGVLDVRRVEVLGTREPRWKVITFSRWTTNEIFDYGYANIYVDTFGTPRPDYYILVGSLGGRLFAELFRDRQTKKDIDLGAISRIGRSDERSFYVRVGLRRLNLGGQRAVFRWRVQTLFTGENCRRVCFDFVPEEGTIAEPLPVSTPSPSPTVTPTPSPSSSA